MFKSFGRSLNKKTLSTTNGIPDNEFNRLKEADIHLKRAVAYEQRSRNFVRKSIEGFGVINYTHQAEI